MVDHEKVIKGLECITGNYSATYEKDCKNCPYTDYDPTDINWDDCKRSQVVVDALALLKMQEQANEQLNGGYIENLITTAIVLKLKDVPLPTGVALEMVRRLKAPEPVKPILDSRAIEFYRCGQCNEPLEKFDKYCWNCGRAVKWDE